VVDEVLAVGDAEFQKKAIGKMQDVSTNQGRTVLFVSHNMNSIQALCKTGVLLINGQLNCYEPIEEIINKYQKLSAESIIKDLKNETNRKGNGKLKFTDIDLVNSKNENISTPLTGQEIIIKVSLESSIDIENIEIVLGLNDEIGQRITLLGNQFLGKVLNIKKGKNTIQFEIKKLPLVAGNYSFALFARVKGEILDWVQNTNIFNIEKGDYYGTGMAQEKNHGRFILDYKIL
jgi:lipopolysaccharide transport system ATP-binding protein